MKLRTSTTMRLGASYRAQRVGYWLDDLQSIQELARLVSVASSRWGGMCEPIFYGPTTLGRKSEEIGKLLKLQYVVDSAACLPAHMAANDLRLEALYEDPYISSPLTFPTPAISSIVTSPTSDPLSLVALGALSDENVNQFRSRKIDVTELDDRPALLLLQMGEFGVIHVLPSGGRERHIHAGYSGASYLWISDGTVKDCIEFWNFRAAVPKFTGSSAWVVSDKSDWSQVGETLRKAFSPTLQSKPDIVLISPTKSLPELEHISELCGFNVKPDELDVTLPHKRNLEVEISNVVPEWTFAEREYGIVADAVALVSGDQVDVRVSTSISLRPVSRIVLNLTHPLFDAPRRAGVARLFHHEAFYSNQSGIELTLAAQSEFHIPIRVPSGDEIIAACLQEKKLNFAVSDKGTMAQGVIALCGGRLEVFRDPRMVRLLFAMRTRRTKSFVEEFGKLERLTEEDIDRIVSKLGPKYPQAHFDIANLDLSDVPIPERVRLVELACVNRLAVRGLEINCQYCRRKYFSETLIATGPIRCPGCGSESTFSSSMSTSPQIKYRLNSLVDLAADNGCLAHLHGMARIAETGADSHLIPGADIFDNASVRLGEIDLLGYIGKWLVVGEIKTRIQEFTHEQIARDIELACAIGADAYIPFADVDFDEELKSYIGAQAAAAKLHLYLVPNFDPN